MAAVMTKEATKKYKKMFGSWFEIVKPFLVSKDFQKIGKFLKSEVDDGKTIFPLFDNVFRCFKECPYDKLKLVILTNNAFLNGEADGLALSDGHAVMKSISTWHPVTTTIMDALESDLETLYLDRNPDLTRWANQGVLLLNCNLTSEKGKPLSHLEIWKPFIDYILTVTQEITTFTIFLLIGKEAGKYYTEIDKDKHDAYTIEHPMLAVKEKRKWKFHRVFTMINNILNFIHGEKINWI